MRKEQKDLTLADRAGLALAVSATVAFLGVQETPAYERLVARAAELVTGADEPVATPE